MFDYLTRTLVRSINQLLLLFGGIFLLAFLLCAVALQIRGAGESLLGRNFHYIVAPGVVCHETGHALGCLLTGTEIQRFKPFSPHGNELGSVVFPRRDGFWGYVTQFVIATGPIWFGCLMIILLTRIFSRRSFKFMLGVNIPHDPMFSPKDYWVGTFKAAGMILQSVVRVWHWRRSLDLIYLYLIFCIVSEMGISKAELANSWVGIICISAMILILNLIPSVSVRISILSFRLCRRLFPIHAIMLFVLIVDFMFFMLFVWPIRFIFN